MKCFLVFLTLIVLFKCDILSTNAEEIIEIPADVNKENVNHSNCGTKQEEIIISQDPVQQNDFEYQNEDKESMQQNETKTQNEQKSPSDITVTDDEWHEFKKTYNKVYESPEEELKRREIYLETKKRVTEHNKKFKVVTYSQGINAFADLSTKEFHDRFIGGFAKRRSHQHHNHPIEIV